MGGGRGGVGKSVLAANLGVYVAQLGRSVLLIDADPAGAALHTVLGIDLPNTAASSSEDEEEENLVALPTQVPGLQLVPQGYRVGSPVPVRPGRKPRWARQVQKARHRLLDHRSRRRHRASDAGSVLERGHRHHGRFTRAAQHRGHVSLRARALPTRDARLLTKDASRCGLERAEAELGPLPPAARFGARRRALRLHNWASWRRPSCPSYGRGWS